MTGQLFKPSRQRGFRATSPGAAHNSASVASIREAETIGCTIMAAIVLDSSGTRQYKQTIVSSARSERKSVND